MQLITYVTTLLLNQLASLQSKWPTMERKIEVLDEARKLKDIFGHVGTIGGEYYSLSRAKAELPKDIGSYTKQVNNLLSQVNAYLPTTIAQK
jgi:hypothetical protein